MASKHGPRYTHIATGEIFELVKTKPIITLIPAFRSSGRVYGEARHPTKITLGRDYKKVTER